jgi:sn-glycerol 3-phosphate transport system substrate-binding protein
MRKRLISSILIAAMTATVLGGCKGSVASTTAGTEGPQKEDKVTEIVFWHGMGGDLGKALDKIVADYNTSQSKMKVTAQYQGSYDEAINKLKSAQVSNSGPDVMQVYEIGSSYMIDSKSIVPMQNFIDKEKYDISSLEPNLLSYYTIDNKLYSMPFNSSTPILYYNKNAFKEAGLDPEKAPVSFAEVAEMSKKLVKKDASGKVTQYGYAMAVYGWFFEQLIGKQGLNYANNGNGRTSKATAVEFDQNGAALNIIKMWKELVGSANVGNYGRKTSDTKNAFIAGNVAMFIDSTAGLNSILTGVNGKFEVGTGYLPKVNESDKGGVSIGGASIWIMDKKDEAKQNAAWEFIKYLVSPEVQSAWNMNTGYFPVTTKAYDIQATKDHLKKYPQFQTAIDQLRDSSANSVGALMGVFPEARQTVEANIEDVLNNKQTPEQAVENSAKTINSAIERYNKTNK